MAASDWVFDWGDNQSAICIESWTRYCSTQTGLFGAGISNIFSFVEERQVHSYVKKEGNLLSEKEGEKLLDKAFLEKFFEDSASARKCFSNLYEEKEKKGVKQLGNAQLAELFKCYIQAYEPLCAFFSASQPEFLAPAERALKRILGKAFSKEEQATAAFTVLTMPTELDAIKREEIDFLKTGPKPDREMLLTYAKRHAWLFFNTYDKDIAINFLKKKVRGLRKMGEERAAEREREIQRGYRELAKKQASILAKLPEQRQASRLASIFQRFAIDRLEIKAVWGGAEFLFQDMFKEIASRAKETIEDFMWVYGIEDALNFLQDGKRLGREEVAKRKNAYLFWLDEGKLRFFSGEEAEELAASEVGFKDEPAPREIEGSIACPGKARGPARVIVAGDLSKLEEDLREFKKGEIMVTTMTQPTMVLMAKKAAAIVTDEGGLTSHAAILAREFGIPCIVGTKIATKAIKTGDLIEVNANKGIIKKVRE